MLWKRTKERTCYLIATNHNYKLLIKMLWKRKLVVQHLDQIVECGLSVWVSVNVHWEVQSKATVHLSPVVKESFAKTTKWTKQINKWKLLKTINMHKLNACNHISRIYLSVLLSIENSIEMHWCNEPKTVIDLFCCLFLPVLAFIVTLVERKKWSIREYVQKKIMTEKRCALRTLFTLDERKVWSGTSA